MAHPLALLASQWGSVCWIMPNSDSQNCSNSSAIMNKKNIGRLISGWSDGGMMLSVQWRVSAGNGKHMCVWESRTEEFKCLLNCQKMLHAWTPLNSLSLCFKTNAHLAWAKRRVDRTTVWVKWKNGSNVRYRWSPTLFGFGRNYHYHLVIVIASYQSYCFLSSVKISQSQLHHLLR